MLRTSIWQEKSRFACEHHCEGFGSLQATFERLLPSHCRAIYYEAKPARFALGKCRSFYMPAGGSYVAAQVFQMHVCMWGALLESIHWMLDAIQAFHLIGYQIIICYQPLAARGLLSLA